MPNNCLSVLYKRIIQVENKNVGLKVGGGGGHKHTIAPPIKKVWGGGTSPLAPAPFLRQWYIMLRTILIVRKETRCRHISINSKGSFICTIPQTG